MTKAKKNILGIMLILVSVLALIATAIYFIRERVNRPRFVRYTAFGIDLPKGYAIHGIDVSRYQRNIDFNAVQAMEYQQVKIGFVFIKATEGLGRVDNSFRKNWFNAHQAALTCGAYHFFICSKSGKAQAENFIETVKLSGGDLPPVLDIESTNGATIKQIQQRAKDWLQQIEKYYQVKPIIYTSVNFYERYLAGKLDEYPLWIAHYEEKEKPRINRDWLIWQHNERGRINGIQGFVDFNVFNGDSSRFKKLLLK